MLRAGLPRRLAALLAIVALVLAQALVAAHACMLAAPADEAAAPCHHGGDEPAPDTLCKAHCEAGTQTVDQAKPLVAPDLGAPLAVRRKDDWARIGADATAGLTRWLAQPGAPPLFPLHCCLRI
jgi:hypothetical protein